MQSTVNYSYGTTSWGDLLTSYNGHTISSDAIGNMTSDGTWNYTWERGRQLASMSNGSTTWNYTYNNDGMRVKRTNGSTTYTYYYNGDLLRYLDINGTKLYFVLDANGQPLEVSYQPAGTSGIQIYYFVMNLQGDVTAIVDTSGNPVVQYSYDAWGNILTTTGSMANTLGAQNPFRYRGYVYDAETGLYYLQSRYYDPELGRFINADAFATTGQGLIGNNMFVYCLNNPVVLEDSQGNSATVAGGVVGGIFGFISALSSELSDDEESVRWNKVWACTLSTAATGAAAGFVADASIASFGVAPAIFISAGGGAILSTANSAFTQKTLTGEVNGTKLFSDAILGGITNGLCTGVSNAFKPIVKGVQKGIEYAATQVTTELFYGFSNIGKFIVDDFLPTFITGFGAWFGSLEYDYLTK